MNIMIIHPLPLRVNQRANQIAKYLSKRGDNVHLILWNICYPITFNNLWENLKQSWRYKKYKEEGVVIHKIRRLPFFFPCINKPWFKSQIEKLYKENNIDIIISESYINETEPPLEYPFIYDFVDDHEAYAKFYGSKFYQLAFKILGVKKTIQSQIENSKFVIVVSDILRDKAKIYNKKVYKIPNGVEPEILSRNFNKKKYNFGNHSLVYVSGFDYWSQLPELLYAVNEVSKEIPDIKLILVGDGYQIPEGKRIVKELNLKNNVKFFGRIENREKLFEIINSCNVCLNLSEKNPRQDSASSVKIFEYSALGKPIVSTRLKEVENLNFPNIIFYRDRNNEYLIEAIKKSFKKKVNKNKIKKLVSKYTWGNIAKQFEERIREMTK